MASLSSVPSSPSLRTSSASPLETPRSSSGSFDSSLHSRSSSSSSEDLSRISLSIMSTPSTPSSSSSSLSSASSSSSHSHSRSLSSVTRPFRHVRTLSDLMRVGVTIRRMDFSHGKITLELVPTNPVSATKQDFPEPIFELYDYEPGLCGIRELRPTTSAQRAAQKEAEDAIPHECVSVRVSLTVTIKQIFDCQTRRDLSIGDLRIYYINRAATGEKVARNFNCVLEYQKEVQFRRKDAKDYIEHHHTGDESAIVAKYGMKLRKLIGLLLPKATLLQSFSGFEVEGYTQLFNKIHLINFVTEIEPGLPPRITFPKLDRREVTEYLTNSAASNHLFAGLNREEVSGMMEKLVDSYGLESLASRPPVFTKEQIQNCLITHYPEAIHAPILGAAMNAATKHFLTVDPKNFSMQELQKFLDGYSAPGFTQEMREKIEMDWIRNNFCQEHVRVFLAKNLDMTRIEYNAKSPQKRASISETLQKATDEVYQGIRSQIT